VSADWKSDLAELFRERRRTRGTFYATRRLAADVASLFTPRPRVGEGLQDVRHAFRLFRKHALVVGITVAGLGLAIAMCTTVFTILNASLFRPYEMDDPSTIVKVNRLYERGMSTTWPYSAFVELQRGSTLATVEASLTDEVRLEPGQPGVRIKPESIMFVSGGYLPMLGGRTVLGRTLDPSDDRPGAAPVVVISHEFWTRYFRSEANVIGRTIRLSNGAATIAGVLRPNFSGPTERPPSFWSPFAAYDAIYGSSVIGASSQIQVRVIARTASSSARVQLSGIAAGLPPMGFVGAATILEKTTGVELVSGASRIDGPDAASVYLVIAIIFLILGLVLALACANVANLLLAGASSRAREFGVRVAMGASRRRLVRQLLTESVVIGIAAGLVGFTLSLWLVPAVTRVVGLPMSTDVSLNWSVMIFSTAIAVASGLGAGLAPARYGSRSDVAGILKAQSLQAGSSPRASRLRRGFIAFQAAASMLLLVTSALFLRAALHITHVDLGFDADKLVTVTVAFPDAPGYGAAKTETQQAQIASFWRTAMGRVSALPSVERVSLTLYPPFSGLTSMTKIDHGGSPYTIFNHRTDAAYFAAAGYRVVRGRAYTAEEVASRAPVALVSEGLARDFLPGVDPIGAPLTTMTADKDGGRITIIGIVADSMASNIRARGNGAVYRPIEPDALADARLVVRTADPNHVIRDVESALVAVDPRVRPSSQIVREGVEKFMKEPQILAGLSSAVAVLALVLSVLGIFGVTSFVVGQRTQEVSVRMAIGASAGDVVRLLIRQNMWPVVGGLAVGLAAALLATRVLTGALSGVSPYDPLAIIPAVVVLATTALAAVAIPALRAARTDPASVLRT
jgi:putative ABC transport system permease protein